jgi:hypothetical protein
VSTVGDPSPDDRTDASPPAVVLHSSWTGIVTSGSGAMLLAVVAAWALVVNGPNVVTVSLALAGLAAVLVVVFDMPIASRFDDRGVTRRALLRHHRVDWDDVDRLSRMRKGWFRSSKMAPNGGLIAVRGRRNIALVDRMEGHVEHRHLRIALGEAGERLGIDRVAAPPLDQTPTWLRRRARWAPDGTGQR